jgi:hypothetical protein
MMFSSLVLYDIIVVDTGDNQEGVDDMPISAGTVIQNLGIVQAHGTDFTAQGGGNTGETDKEIPLQDTGDSVQLSGTLREALKETAQPASARMPDKDEVASEKKKDAPPDPLAQALDQCNKEGKVPGKITLTPTGALMMEDQGSDPPTSPAAGGILPKNSGVPGEAQGQKPGSQTIQSVQDGGKPKPLAGNGLSREERKRQVLEDIRQLKNKISDTNDRRTTAFNDYMDARREVDRISSERDGTEDPDIKYQLLSDLLAAQTIRNELELKYKALDAEIEELRKQEKDKEAELKELNSRDENGQPFYQEKLPSGKGQQHTQGHPAKGSHPAQA